MRALFIAIGLLAANGDVLADSFEFAGLGRATTLQDVARRYPNSAASGSYVRVSPKDTHDHIFGIELFDSRLSDRFRIDFESPDRKFPLCETIEKSIAMRHGRPAETRDFREEAMWNRVGIWKLELETVQLQCFRSGTMGAFLAEAIAVHPVVEADLTVTYLGKTVPLGVDASAQLRGDLEELLSGCSLSSPSTDAQPRAELEVALDYRRPKTLASQARVMPQVSHVSQVQLDRILLTASASANGGWPTLRGSGPGLRQDFYKCDGGKILDTVCTQELQEMVPAQTSDNCSLAPRRRAGRS